MLPMAALIPATVMHCRMFPLRYRFRYAVASLMLDLDRLPEIAARYRWLSWNRFNLLAFYQRDHGPRDGSPLRPWVERQLSEAGIHWRGGRLLLVAMPRFLGFVFNPLSLYFCYRDDRLIAIVCQVKNTFGEQHCYVLHDGGHPLPPVARHVCPKRFHVSPFIGMDAEYHFAIRLDDQGFRIAIEEYQDGQRMLVATQQGPLQPVSDGHLLKQFLKMPLMSFKVVAMIHWQALKLWLRGAPFFRKPEPPREDISSCR